jgi:phospholipase A1
VTRPRYLRAAVCLAAWMGASPAIRAQGVVDCVALQDNSARLACYDRWHGRGAVAPPPAEKPLVETRPAAGPQAPAPAAPVLDHTLAKRWDLDGHRGSLFAPRAYRPVYMLPATWTNAVNRRPASPAPDHAVAEDLALRNVEAKYQLSLKAKFGHSLLGTPASLWGGYTQSSRWQVYHGASSRPFRETNYEPELMLVWPMNGRVLGWQMEMGSLSLNHQSNGRSLPLSRSWNRVIGSLALRRGDWVMEVRPWLRLPEQAQDDDNPDIDDHIGRGELLIGRYWGEHAMTLQLRHSLRGGQRSRGSAQWDWVFPLTGALHGYLQVFSGSGESLVDYNQKQTKIGLGVTIAGWR